MREVTEPKVYVVGRQVLDNPALKRFLEDIGRSSWYKDYGATCGETLSEVAGRCCYKSFGIGRKSNKDFLSHIIEAKHGSVLEHAVWSFLFHDVSRSLTHELVRHRHFSYSQLSQRYVDESDTDFIVPSGIQNTPVLREKWRQGVLLALDLYKDLASELNLKYSFITDATARRKMARQEARSVLPNCTATTVFVTGNARAWRHFIEMRGSRFADTEIRTLAFMVYDLLKEEAPNMFGDYYIGETDGVEEIKTSNPGV